MVKGLELFRDHFRDHLDRFVLIGGVACDLLMTGAGLGFRATKDLDIVLTVEGMDLEFGSVFWSFIQDGGYASRALSESRPKVYRFRSPTNENYPYMLELFSRVPEALTIAEGSHLTPIPIAGDISSLSAILMDDDYYAFIQSGREMHDGLPVARADRLMALKARAWLDLSRRKDAGEIVDRHDIKKHRNDIFRLFRIVDPGTIAVVPPGIRADFRDFVERMRSEPVDLRALGLVGVTQDDVLTRIATIFAAT